jgi:hypothetical protein
MGLVLMPKAGKEQQEMAKTLLEYWLARGDVEEIVVIVKTNKGVGGNLEFSSSILQDTVWWVGAMGHVLHSLNTTLEGITQEFDGEGE